MTDKSAWAWYLAGALLTLAWKWYLWIRTGKMLGKGIKQSTREWFALTLREDQVSWIATVAVVWVVGCLAIDKAVTTTGIEWLDKVLSLPVFDAGAFALGIGMEYAAPFLAKKLLAKVQEA